MKTSVTFLQLAIVALVSLSAQIGVKAEHLTDVPINLKLSPGALSPWLYGDIRDSGYLNVAELKFGVVEAQTDSSFVEVVVSILPDDWTRTTANNQQGKDMLQAMGVGASGNDNKYHECCTQEAIDANACDDLGSLIVSHKKGIFRSISVEIGANMLSRNQSLAMEGVVSFEFTSHVALVFANCNTNQSPVTIKGDVIWMSYVASNRLPLSVVLMMAHMALACWFRFLMVQNQNSRIKMEEWIFGTLLLAVAAATFSTVLMTVEVVYDHQVSILMLMAELVNACKHIASRCLYVTVALGLGVVTASLEKTTKSAIIAVGASWLAASSLNAATEIMDPYNDKNFVTSLTGKLVTLLNFVFFIWIPIALMLGTIKGLKAVGDQELKLNRYRIMMRIYILAVILTFLLWVLFFWDMISDGGREFDLTSVVVGNELIYFVVLACIAVLWRPNPDAQNYSYVLLMEEDDEGNGNFDLEMTVTDTK